MTIKINGTNTTAQPSITGTDTDTGLVYGTDEVKIVTGGTDRVKVDSSGNVGIGTTSPEYVFDTRGSINISGSIFRRGADNATFSLTNRAAQPLTFGTNDTERMRIDSSGRVGIGTTEPTATLHVSASEPAIFIQDANGAGAAINATIQFRDSSDTQQAYFGYASPSDNHFSLFNKLSGGDLRFGTASTERMRIDSSGNVGIGTTSPTHQLTVHNASTTAGTIEANRFSVRDNYGNASGLGNGIISPAANSLAFATNSTERMRIDGIGQTYIYNSNPYALNVKTSAAAGATDYILWASSGATNITTGGSTVFAVYTNGDVKNTNNSYGSLSDLKLKENIVDATSQWSDIKALQVRKYNFKEGQTHTQIGLIAQEVEQVSPGLVSESPDRDEDGNDLGTVTKSVNYSVLYMKAVKALQEAMERIETLETQNASLEARLTALEGGSKLMPIKLNGATSGSVELDVPAAVGSDLQVTLPATAGEIVVKDSSGRVGIGTSAPSTSLHVKASNTTGKGQFIIQSASAGQEARMTFIDGSDDIAEISTDGNNLYFYNETATGAFQWYTNNTERMRIDSSGRLLVGTSSSPSLTDGQYAKIHLVGNTASATGDSVLNLGRGVAASSGIASGTSLGILQFTDSAGAAHATIKGLTDGTTGTNDYPGRLVFSTTADGASSPTERVRIDSSGRLLVGTTSSVDSSAKTQIVGDDSVRHLALKYTGTTGGAEQQIKWLDKRNQVNAAIGSNLQNDNAGSAAADLIFRTATGNTLYERMRINASGQIFSTGVYNYTSANAANVYVFSDGLLVRSTSSIKYKTEVETIQDSYSDALLACRPVWYRSTSSTDKSNWGYWGFIAEEVAEIDPRLVNWKTTEVSYDDKGSMVETPCEPEPEGVQYDRFVPHLLNLIKRQQQAIETLETKVAALEATS